MRRFVLLISIVVMLTCCYSTLWAFTLTFDDIPAGQGLSYYTALYNIDWLPSCIVVDESKISWISAPSQNNVLAWKPVGNPTFVPAWYFGSDVGPKYTVSSVGAYFSTDMDQVFTLEGFRKDGSSFSANIGAVGSSWRNQYVEIDDPEGAIYKAGIFPVGSDDTLSRFCMDNLTIEPVPEPSSLLTLGVLASGLGVGLIRRRRR